MTATDATQLDELVAEAWRLSPDTFMQRLHGPAFTRPPHLRVLARFARHIALKPNGRGAIFLPPRHLKALDVRTPIATPTGWTTQGELRPGDLVYNAEGEPTPVTAVTEHWRTEGYGVRFDDGTEIVADAGHLWCTFSRTEARAFHENRRYHNRAPDWPRRWHQWRSPTGIGPTVRRTDEIDVGHDAKHLIPLALPLCTPEAELPLDPWVLGYWLGNGTRKVGAVTTGGLDGVTDLEGVTAELDRAGWRYVVRNRGDNVATVHVYNLIHTLRLIGVDDKQPADLSAYLRASVDQRWSLLQGLLDSDGTRQSRTVRGVSFTTTTKWLADLTAELAVSLGHKVTRGGRRAMLDGRDCGPCWDVRFSTPLGPFRLPRKTATMLPPDARFIRTRHRTIVAIEPAGSTTVCCIKVADPSGMYLAGEHLIPTHNTTVGSIGTPAWLLSLNPATRILQTTYAKELGRGWGRAVRDLLVAHEKDDDGNELLGHIIASDSRASDRFETISRGGMWTTGIGGTLLGLGADLGVIDDPVKNYQDAHSPTVRESTWQWYLSTFLTRLQPGASVLLIMQRWHEDDLSGRILSSDSTKQWEVLKLPAIAEEDEVWDLGGGETWTRAEGDALWPEQYPVEAFQRMRAEGFSEYLWNGMYQQRPSRPEGGEVEREWFRYWYPQGGSRVNATDIVMPEELDELLISVDCAFKGESDNDYVVMQCWAREGIRRFLLDEVRDKMTFVETVTRLYQFHQKWPGATKVLVEDKANGPAVVNTLKTKIPGLMERSPGTDSKLGRLRSVVGLIQAGNVYIPQQDAWVGAYVEELATFPKAKWDDRVDATTQALREWTPEAGRGKVRAVTARSDVQVPMSPTGRKPKPKGGMRGRAPGSR